jgi:hypothetical protein
MDSYPLHVPTSASLKHSYDGEIQVLDIPTETSPTADFLISMDGTSKPSSQKTRSHP